MRRYPIRRGFDVPLLQNFFVLSPTFIGTVDIRTTGSLLLRVFYASFDTPDHPTVEAIIFETSSFESVLLDCHIDIQNVLAIDRVLRRVWIHLSTHASLIFTHRVMDEVVDTESLSKLRPICSLMWVCLVRITIVIATAQIDN